MKRVQAQELLGKHISAWTATHGVYFGILLDVICRPGKPWRGKVKIVKLTDAQGAVPARWYTPGTIIEVGNCSISAAEIREEQPQ